MAPALGARAQRLGAVAPGLLALLLLAACGDGSLYVGSNELDAGVAIDASDPAPLHDAQLHDAQPASRCVPGTYLVSIMGTYRSGLNGIPGVVAPLAGPNQGQFLFRLEASTSPEFLVVGNGCLTGEPGADAGTTGAALLTGRVDCTTGVLTSQLSGFYDAAGQRVFMHGTYDAVFEPSSMSFVGGSWRVREPAVLVGEQPGGEGTWSAVPKDASVPNADVDACLGGVDVPDF